METTSSTLISRFTHGRPSTIGPYRIEYFHYTSNPCSPILSVPPQIFNLDPKWKTCVQGIQVLYDPPYALTQASGLVPVAQTTGDPPVPTTKAQSGPLPQAPASKTPAAQDPPAAPSKATVFQPQPVTQTSVPSKPGPPKGNDPAVLASVSAPNDPPAPSNSPVAPPPITMGSQTISANSAGSVVVGSVTLLAGAPAVTINNTPVSLGSAGLIIASSTYAIPAAAPKIQPADPAANPPVLTLGSSPVTANSLSHYIAGTQTLAPGGPALILSGTTYSLPSSSPNIIVINGATSTLAARQPQPTPAPAPAPVLTLGATPITANSASQYILGTQTLSPGSPPITISGTTYSLPTSATVLLVNGVPSALPAQPKQSFTPTLDSASRALILDPSQTLSVGEVLTYSGEIVSLRTTTGGVPDGVVVISGTKTTTVGLGAWIASGIGMGPAGGAGTSTLGLGSPFQGTGCRVGGRGWWRWGLGGVIWLGWWVSGWV
ncbi:hypothetical protein MMC30_004709 [Trapelia coarctata]|nr:hypothetical protein [Trapelia coarctata]